MSNLKYWIWLSSIAGLGASAAARLLNWFGSPEQVFFADEKTYLEVPDIRSTDIAKLSSKNLGFARKVLSDCEEKGYRILTLSDAEYPSRLKNIYDPPILLYVRGRLPAMDDEAAVGVVGTRKCTPYGIKSAERVGYELTRCGCLVVSGLARGIDSAAAVGALRAGGRVVGVIGSGLDVIYPPENEALFDDVANSGAVISEYPPGSPAISTHFPARNRIISGVSAGVAVIEAPKNSGALITAARALEQGRDVFALPGNVDSPACEGSNRLLREGATVFMSGSDIAEEYRGLYPDKVLPEQRGDYIPIDRKQAEKLLNDAGEGGKKLQNTAKKVIDNDVGEEYIDLIKVTESLSEDEKTIFSLIGQTRTHIDEIIAASGLPAGTVLSVLTMLEIKGCVIQSNGKYFSRS